MKMMFKPWLMKYGTANEDTCRYQHTHFRHSFPSSKPAKALLKVSQEHEMVLCQQNLTELREVIKQKLPEHLADVEILLLELSYELIPASCRVKKLVRDPKDQPILNAAMLANVDL